uniref:hypothetical protein n=1 Tax=Hericium alpestre TaxID=135208 RepID=UPI0024353734|nr:hypothetical protein QEO35_mgp38 [Hericium alpestre]WEX31995.1 hypothetical protein [Hericium alpestre]
MNNVTKDDNNTNKYFIITGLVIGVCLGVYFGWDYFNVDYQTKINLLTEFKNILESNKVYAVTPIFISLEYKNIISLSTQIIITDKVNINDLEAWLLGVYEINILNYKNIIDNGYLILKYRIISINKDIYHLVSNKNKIINIPIKNRINKLGIDKVFTTNKLFPNSIDLNDYGFKVKNNINNINNILYHYRKDIFILVNDLIKNNNLIRKCDVFKNNSLILSYEDRFNSNNNYFLRYVNNKTLTINKDSYEIINMEYKINCKYIQPEKIDLIEKYNFITLDIETFISDNNVFVPYSIGYYDGITNEIFYLTDFKDSNDMLERCIKTIIESYNNYIIYAHNLSNFDFYFIIKYLVSQSEIKFNTFYKDNKLYSLKLSMYIKDIDKVYSVTIKDSYLLLPASLRRLGKDFKVITKKGIFPYTFVNKNNLNYIGNIPDYDYYKDDLSYNEYIKLNKEFLNKQWDLKNETKLFIIWSNLFIWSYR